MTRLKIRNTLQRLLRVSGTLTSRSCVQNRSQYTTPYRTLSSPHLNSMPHLPLIAFSVLSYTLLAAGKGTNSVAKLKLPGNKTDSCNSHLADVDKGDCIQAFVELFVLSLAGYRQATSTICPSIGLNLAILNCAGCPWDRLDHNAINASSIIGVNLTKLFHPPRKSCTIVDFVERALAGSRIHPEVLGVILPTFSNLFLARSDDTNTPKTFNLFGFRIHEAVYVAFLLVAYIIGDAYACIAQVVTNLCESQSSSVALSISRHVNYVSLIILLLWRVRNFKTYHEKLHLQSWATYRESGLEPKRWKCVVTELLYSGGPLVIFLSCILDLTGSWWFPNFWSRKGESMCFFGAVYDPWVAFLRYGELSLVFVTIFVFLLGPSGKRFLRVLRFVVLLCAALLSFVDFIFKSFPIFRVIGVSSFIPWLPDACFYFGQSAMSLTLVVSLLGVAEPLRLGWDFRADSSFALEKEEEMFATFT